jgi:hypothetical protein
MTGDPGSETYDFEYRLSQLLAAAQEAVGRANLALQEALLSDVRRDSMPQIAVWRLHLGATSTFFGIIQCLRSRFSSLGGYSLLRGLIEAWTHLYFIADESEAGTPALRAIRFEAGVLSEWASVEKKIRPEIDYDEITRRHRETIKELWNANHGKGEPKRRTYKDVNRTLEKMAKAPDLKRLEIFHSSSSVAVHMLASDFLLESSGLGVTVVWASTGRRYAWLQLAIMCFDYLTISALSSVPSPEHNAIARELHARWQEIYNDPLLVHAVAAESDSEWSL